MGIEKYKDGFEVRTHEDALHIPYSWRGSKIVFVNSMSDLFHKDVPIDFIQQELELYFSGQLKDFAING